jgi:hypothetical protein
MLIPLLFAPPWVKRENGKSYSFQENTWTEIKPDNRNQLNQVAGQVWLTLYNLILEPECRKKYPFTTNNKPTILKLRNLLTDQLIDTISNLSALQKFLEQLNVVDIPAPTDLPKVFMIEQVRQLYNSLMIQGP